MTGEDDGAAAAPEQGDSIVRAVASAPRHGCAVPRGQARSPTATGRGFGRMFPFLPVRHPSRDAINAIIRLLHQTSDANPAIAAGYTYLGQFIDHDLTFDSMSQLGRDNDPLALVNSRTPRLDLDSLYGSGPRDQPFLYEWDRLCDRGVKLSVGRNTSCDELAGDDLPRNDQGLALTGDPRNDENAIVAQLHLLFIKFHNNVVEHVRSEEPHLLDADLFDEARRIVRWHYQWIVVHDFLERIVGRDLARAVLRPATPDTPPTVDRRFFTWEDAPSIPVEFSGAAYRFGHSMVRDGYFVQLDTPSVAIFPDGGSGDTARADPDKHLGGFRRLRAALEIDWSLFFFDENKVEDGAFAQEHHLNLSLRIDRGISKRLFHIQPGGDSLPLLNLRRGVALGLPAGRDVARSMGEEPLTGQQLRLPAIPEHLSAEVLRTTPLWYYVLSEARELGDGGQRLGPVGGRIVAEVLIGLLEADPESYLRQWPRWTPCLPAATRGDFTMRDLVAFASRTVTPAGAPPRGHVLGHT